MESAPSSDTVSRGGEPCVRSRRVGPDPVSLVSRSRFGWDDHDLAADAAVPEVVECLVDGG
jgi:hypothetical protein